MKLTKLQLDEIANEWGDAYRADYHGRTISCEIIKALFNSKFNKEDAKEIYYSKNLRWFFDEYQNVINSRNACKLFCKYLTKNKIHISDMFKSEFKRKLTKNQEGWIVKTKITREPTVESVTNDIQSYLGNGGLFNSEAMEHDKVRDLILNCRTVIHYQTALIHKLIEERD